MNDTERLAFKVQVCTLNLFKGTFHSHYRVKIYRLQFNNGCVQISWKNWKSSSTDFIIYSYTGTECVDPRLGKRLVSQSVFVILLLNVADRSVGLFLEILTGLLTKIDYSFLNKLGQATKMNASVFVHYSDWKSYQRRQNLFIHGNPV